MASWRAVRPDKVFPPVAPAEVTRGYRWWTAVGVRVSFVDDGLTFGTNTKAGMCVHFRDKVPSTLGLKGYSALTVTVVDLDGLVRALGQSRVSPEPGAPCRAVWAVWAVWASAGPPQLDSVSLSRPGLTVDVRLASRTSLSSLYQRRASHITQASQPTTTIHNRIPGGLVTLPSCTPCQPGRSA